MVLLVCLVGAVALRYITMPMVSKLAAGPFTPMALGPLTLKSRFIKAATFEGRMPRGEVTEALVDFHAEVAEGGAAMTTVAYCAISPGGRGERSHPVGPGVGDETGMADLRA